MRTIVNTRSIVLILGLIISCHSTNNEQNRTAVKSQETENFNKFIVTFYSDTSFQQSRILMPLKGKIQEWHEIKDSVVVSSWNDRDIILTDYGKIQSTLENTIHSIDEYPDSTIEKIYIENSGFILVRTFIILEGKWFLKSYDISNL